MPRTKVPREDTTDDRNKNEINDMKKIWLKQVENEIQNQKLKSETEYKEIMQKIEAISFFRHSAISPEIKNKAMGELKLDKSSLSILSNIVSTSTLEILNHTKNNTIARNKVQNISDEGYLTAGSRPTSCDRARSRAVEPTSSRKSVSRSISRSNMPKHVSIHPSAKTQTPKTTLMPNSMTFGFVTPKVKPNSTLSLLRRPKLGEMAISMQGSPLLVSGVVTESCANVNIPLQDGRILSLQPTHGIRASQVPELDEDTKRQLLTLSDNLNKVVKLSEDI